MVEALTAWWPLIVGAYLLGSLSFSLLVVRLLKGEDIRETGSGNAGATNVLRTVGKGPALLVLALDVAKGWVPVVIGRGLEAPGWVLGAAALAAVMGHVFPLFFGLRGGKGMATTVGALASLAPLGASMSAVVFALAVLTTRWVSLGSIGATATFPAWVHLGGRLGWTEPAPAWLLVSASAIALLVIGKHHENIRRILAGTEHRLGTAVEEK